MLDEWPSVAAHLFSHKAVYGVGGTAGREEERFPSRDDVEPDPADVWRRSERASERAVTSGGGRAPADACVNLQPSASARASPGCTCTFTGVHPLFPHVAAVSCHLCVGLIARKAASVNDGQRPSLPLGSSPVSVRPRRMDGHLEAIAQNAADIRAHVRAERRGGHARREWRGATVTWSLQVKCPGIEGYLFSGVRR